MVLYRVTNRPVRGEDLLRDATGILARLGEDRREHSAERGQTNSLEAADTPQCSCMSVFEPPRRPCGLLRLLAANIAPKYQTQHQCVH